MERNMQFKNTQNRYSTLVIGLHWLMLLVLMAVYALMELRGIAPKGSDLRANMKALHYLLGLSALALVVLRIGTRLTAGPAPDIKPALPYWQDKLSRLLHYALYAFMVATPILGWLTLSADGKPIILFGWQIPSLLAANESLADQIKELHEAVASAGYFLIGLHALAGLFHHYIQRDNTLVRMLPSRAVK